MACPWCLIQLHPVATSPLSVHSASKSQACTQELRGQQSWPAAVVQGLLGLEWPTVGSLLIPKESSEMAPSDAGGSTTETRPAHV